MTIDWRTVTQTQLSESLKKLENGDGINDFELDLLLSYFTDLEKLIYTLNDPAFHHAWYFIYLKLERLQYYKKARAEK